MSADRFQVRDAELGSARDAAALVEVLDSYAREPVGGGVPLDAEVRARLAPALREQIARGTAVVMLASRGERVVGAGVCFVGFSTFRARPLLNIHDLAVLPEVRGQGAGTALLDAIEARARKLGCCKLTLEVREDNVGARRLYLRHGFGDYAPSADPTRTHFIEKKL
jgi:ribosomal protein S18 acetylase RimI-like enzyme